MKPIGDSLTAYCVGPRKRDHAEYILLERKCQEQKYDNCILFATLELCTPRIHNFPKPVKSEPNIFAYTIMKKLFILFFLFGFTLVANGFELDAWCISSSDIIRSERFYSIINGAVFGTLTTENSDALNGHNEGDIFVVHVGDVDMTFEIQSIADKTVKVGNGKESAVATSTSGALIIPPMVTHEAVEYSIVGIADSAFINCKNLTSIELPGSITSSGKDAFRGCTGLKKVATINLKAWCEIAFANKYSNPLYYSMHLYSSDDIEIKDLVIPSDLSSLGNYCFINCLLNSVVISGSITQIGDYSFSGCTSLESVQMDEGIDRIRSRSFYGCTGLISLTLPSTITRVDPEAFRNCSNLLKVTMEGFLAPKLGDNAFSSVDSNCTLYVPVGSLTSYFDAGWTSNVFGGLVKEYGEVKENVNLENTPVAAFMKDVTYPNDDYSYTKVTEYAKTPTKYRKDIPFPVKIKAPSLIEGDKFLLETYCNDLLERTDTFYAGQQLLPVWNLIPQNHYSYKICSLCADSTKKEICHGYFCTAGQERMLNVSGLWNFRDIGGWKIPPRKRVKYDKIFRSAALHNIQDIYELLNVFGIQVEIDFREDFTSPIEGYIEYVKGKDYQILPYKNGLEKTKVQYKNCFDKVVESLKSGKKVLFHCAAGADRTGTFALLLEGLLGVSESDLAKEYELTSFSKKDPKYHHRGLGGYGHDLFDYIKTTFKGQTINEQIENMAIESLGISQESINDFRELMTEEVQDVKLGDANCDGTIDVGDAIVIVDYVIGKDFPGTFNSVAADVNQNGTINVGDAIAVVDYVIGNTSPLYKPISVMENNDYLTISQRAQNGFSVSLQNEISYRAFQCDIEMPEGLNIESISLNSTRSNGHTLYYNKKSENKYNLVAMAMNDVTLNGNSGELFRFNVSGYLKGEISLNNIVFYDGDVNEIVMRDLLYGGTIDGIDKINNHEEDDDIFDLSGCRINIPSRNLKKGIYITKNKKILVK